MFSAAIYLTVFLVLVSQSTCAASEANSESIAAICLKHQRSCSECISAHPSCSWCTDKIQTFAALQKRCKIKSENLKTCSNESIVDPKLSQKIIKDEEFGEMKDETLIQIKPQHTNIRIRAGEVFKMNVTYKKLLNYPLDLYYVLDLSLSMHDDLQNLKTFGSSLVERIKNITDNVHLGFGTFVDKVLMPYASHDKKFINLTCSAADTVCQQPFGFRHQLSLTSDGSQFKKAVDKTTISTNIDVPEGSIDALMQIAVCKNIIKWREQALHVILLTTDAPPHIAMDGKVANVHEPSGQNCQLEKVSEEDNIYEYMSSQIRDYPSLGQLHNAFRDHQIQAIFAVTKEVEDVYKSFPTVFSNSYVETLSNDSSNIMIVISNAYDQIKNKFKFSKPKHPNNLKLSYRIMCPNSTEWVDNSLECSNVEINSEVIVELTMVGTCPEDRSSSHQIQLTSATLSSTTTIDVDYICDCNCSSIVSQNRSFCNDNGDVKCGLCSCDDGWSGPNCQCRSNKTTAQLEEACTSRGKACSGKGVCNCGTCSCNSLQQFGKHCQCVSTGCRKMSDQSEYCGGLNRGSCMNCNNDQRCNCNNNQGWFYSNQTLLCDCNKKMCMKPGSSQLCSGRGTCNCDRCNCFNSTLHYGDYCENCGHPNCLDFGGTCYSREHQACALCLYQNPTSTECTKLCDEKQIVGEIVENFPNCEACTTSSSSEVCRECAQFDKKVLVPVSCSTRDENSCWAKYQIFWSTAYRSYYILVKRRDVLKDCPQPVDPLLIALSASGSVILTGLLIMIIWRLVQNRIDMKRYQEFLKECGEAEWQDKLNPVYKECIMRTENPNFVG